MYLTFLYIVRVTRTWKILADELNTSMDSLGVFKSFLLNYYFTALNTSFNIDDARTFKTICCKCNTARIALITELLAVFSFN